MGGIIYSNGHACAPKERSQIKTTPIQIADMLAKDIDSYCNGTTVSSPIIGLIGKAVGGG
jgi:hypothetical protein